MIVWTVLKAFRWALRAHIGQKDLAGRPYMLHVMAVAEHAAKFGGAAVATALLHDVVEDSDITLEQVAAAFPADIAEAVDWLTRDKSKGQTYAEYIFQLSHNQLARLIKICDLQDHLVRELPKEKTSLHKRYKDAFDFLVGVEEMCRSIERYYHAQR